MKNFKKNPKKRRGMTLVEVLIVVALMAILLGLAMPDLISQARRIKHAELDNNARAVAVAVQSRLYGLRNSANDDYKSFNTVGSQEIEEQLSNADGQPIEDEVRWAANFAAIVKSDEGEEGGGKVEPTEEEEKAAKAQAEIAKQLVFSGALTELDLLEKGKILIVYKPATGDIVYAFYSESEFDVETILTLIETQTLDEETLFELEIGYYFGVDAPDPLMNDSLPRVSLNFSYDDEMILEILIAKPKEMFENTPLAIEIFISNDQQRNQKMLIYSEGLFASDKVILNGSDATSKATSDTTIKKDKPLCFANMPKEKKTVTIKGETKEKETGRYHLRFAIDSLVVTHVYDQIRPYLLHNSNPYAQNGTVAAASFTPGTIEKDKLGVSVAQELLYPRNEFSTWMGQSNFSVGNNEVGKGNLFTQEWISRMKKENGGTGTETDDSKYQIQPIPIDGQMSLSVELHALKQSDGTNAVAEDGETTDEFGIVKKDGIRVFDDASIAPAKATSLSANPYFRQINLHEHTAWLGSIRELSNLTYLFNTTNGFTNARLWSNIEGDQFYDKLESLRKFVFTVNGTEGTNNKYGQLDYTDYTGGSGQKKDINLNSNDWAQWANREQVNVTQMKCTKDGFVLDGANPYYKPGSSGKDVPPRFLIRNIGLGASGSPWISAGLFSVIKNGTFKNLEVVNALSYMNVYERNFLGSDSDSDVKISGTNRLGSEGINGFAGTLCAFAVDCKFENVYVYNDSSKLTMRNSSIIRIGGICAGGICGIAIGSGNSGKNGSTGASEFTNCLASTRIIANIEGNGQTCVYGGGLCGITMGNVKISGCYAAGQIGAYYSGGLVGRVISNGKWDYGKDPTDSENKKELSGELKDNKFTTVIKDSFAAGQIYRFTRVGGGLIAKNDYTSGGGNASKPVSGCYAAVWYEAVPPVVFGTFKGDTQNRYVYQTAVNVPITSYVEAAFTFTGKENDLFQLGKNPSKQITNGEGEAAYNGIACTVKELNDFYIKTEGTSLAAEEKDEENTTVWRKVTNSNTHRYAYNNNMISAVPTLDSADSYQLGYREYRIDTDKNGQSIYDENGNLKEGMKSEYYTVGGNNGNNHDLWTNQINLSAYPFPIQSHFADFYGDWIKRYVRYDSGYKENGNTYIIINEEDSNRSNLDKIGKVLLPARDEGENETSTTNAATNNGYTFHGYYYLCYFLAAGATNNHVDPGAIATHSLTYDHQSKIVLSTEGEKKVAQTNLPSNSDWGTAVTGTFNPELLYREVKDVTPTTTPKTAAEWFLAEANEGNEEEKKETKVYEHGTYGATGVSTEGENLVFTDVLFFSKDYDPVKGITGLKIKTNKEMKTTETISAFLAAADGGEVKQPDYENYSYSNGEIYWDYRGFYVMALFNDESHGQGYAYTIFYLVDSTEFASSSTLVSEEPSEDGIINALRKGYVEKPYGNNELVFYYVDVDFDLLIEKEKEQVKRQNFTFDAKGEGVTPQWDSQNNCIVVKGNS